jgi:hypothetical protein
MRQQPIYNQAPINNQPPTNSQTPINNQLPTNNQLPATNQTLINTQSSDKELTKTEKIIKISWNVCRWIWIVFILVIATTAIAAILTTSLEDFDKDIVVKITGWLLSPALGARLIIAFIGIFIIITAASGILAWRIQEIKETPDSDYIHAISTHLENAAKNSAKYNEEFVEYRRLLIETLNQGQIPLIFSRFYQLYKDTAASKKDEFVKQNSALNENLEKLIVAIGDLKQANVSQLEELNNNLKSLTGEVATLRQDNLAVEQDLNEKIEKLTTETSAGTNALKQYVQQQVLSNLPPEQLTAQ